MKNDKTMLTKILFILTLVFSLNLTGCSFATQNRSISPHFNGILKFGDNAIGNAKIMLSIVADDKSCFKAKKFTTTNKQGQFSLKAIIEEYSYTPFVNYELDAWTVCTNYNNQIYTLYSNNRYGSGNVSSSVYLECDLASPVIKPCNASH